MHAVVCGNNVSGWFHEGLCDSKRSNNSLWVAYAMDVATDIMGKTYQSTTDEVWSNWLRPMSTDDCYLVMLLPLTLVRNLQMTFVKKCSLGLLFALGFFIMIAATVRAVQINEHSYKPQPTWVALWSIIEFSVGELHRSEHNSQSPRMLTLQQLL